MESLINLFISVPSKLATVNIILHLFWREELITSIQGQLRGGVILPRLSASKAITATCVNKL